MSCSNCKRNISSANVQMRASRPVAPCHPCAMEHLQLAEAAHRDGKLYRAVWHLAQAATHAAMPQQAEAIRNARIAMQRINEKVDFAQLRQLIGGTHAEH